MTPLRLLLLLGGLAWPTRVASAPACETSGYCSKGISKQWVGDIKDSNQFRDMLEAVSYKKELITTSWSSGGATLAFHDQVLQLHAELLEHGYAHFVLVTTSESDCNQIARANLSCVWDSTQVPGLGGLGGILLDRWKFAARVSRLGYNLMCLDADFLVFSDPYIHIKNGLMGNAQLLYKPEGWFCFPNTAFFYIQNARPDGPITWALMDAMRTAYRRADDNYKFVEEWTGQPGICAGGDQEKLGDSMCSAMVGRPVFPMTMLYCKHKLPGIEEMRRQVGRFLDRAPYKPMKMEMDEAFLAKTNLGSGLKRIPHVDFWGSSMNMTVPNMNLGSPDEFGGRMFSEDASRVYSNAWIDMLKSDCPACPWWPEYRPVTRDPMLDIARANASIPEDYYDTLYEPDAVRELVMVPPAWLQTFMVHMRRGMMLGKSSPYQGYMVMAHIHAWHFQTTGTHKMMIRKIMGRYDWNIGSEVARIHTGQPVPYLVSKKVSRVLALSPSVDLSRTRNWTELSSIITGLYEVAHLSRRVLLLPELPCQTAWMHSFYAKNLPDLNQTLCIPPTFLDSNDLYPSPILVPVDNNGELIGGWARKLLSGGGGDGGPASGRRPGRALLLADPAAQRMAGGGEAAAGQGGGAASWWEKHKYVAIMPAFWDEACTHAMNGMISPEYHHWLKHDPDGQKANRTPTPANTVFTANPAEPRLQLNPPMAPGGDSAAVPPGWLVPESNTTGWSWYDVQASVTAQEVVWEMDRVHDEPLVFVNHPVMVVPSSQAAAASELTAEQDPRKDPDTAIRYIHEHLKKSKCKALWTEVETTAGTVVNLDYGLKARLQNNILNLV